MTAEPRPGLLSRLRGILTEDGDEAWHRWRAGECLRLAARAEARARLEADRARAEIEEARARALRSAEFAALRVLLLRQLAGLHRVKGSPSPSSELLRPETRRLLGLDRAPDDDVAGGQGPG